MLASAIAVECRLSVFPRWRNGDESRRGRGGGFLGGTVDGCTMGRLDNLAEGWVGFEGSVGFVSQMEKVLPVELENDVCLKSVGRILVERKTFEL